MKAWEQEKIRKLFAIVFVVVLTIIPLSLCFNRSVWLDEAFSLRWSTLPFPNFVKRIVEDVHPPLYYLFLRMVLTLTNNSLFAAKIFSVAAVTLLFVIGAVFVRKEFGCKAMVFYGLFVLFNPMMLKKAVEVRMYTWAFLSVTYSSVQMYYLLKQSPKKKNWILFTLSSVAAAYTHYFAALSLVVVYAGLLIFHLFTRNWKQIKAWMICAGCTILLYLPWLPILLKQVKSDNVSWIQPATSRLGVMRDMLRTDIPKIETIYMLLMIGFLIGGLVLFCRRKTAELYWSLVCMSAVWVVLAFGLLYEKLMRPLLSARYLMIPLYISILGMSVLWKYIPKYILVIPVIFFLVTGASVYRTVFVEEYHTRTDETLQFAEEHVRDGDIIFYDADSLCSVIPYYFPNMSEQSVDIYAGDYEYLWYFDTYQSLDYEKLDKEHKKYVVYSGYGFDNVNFDIIYITCGDVVD
ncbi:MAG: hypothetical protein HDQ99_16670 [Lachnospiraceae bacterium]|nr:hypothetical protein [Lachnospiraceae bacterium]